MHRLWSGTSLKFFAFLLGAMCHLPVSHAQGALKVTWIATQPATVIQEFQSDELKKLKHSNSTEADGRNGKRVRFEGVLLSDVIEKSLTGMGNEKKAQVDLVILKNPQGVEALIPRSFLVKYPVLLAQSEDRKSLGALKSVVPWTSHPKARGEGLPLETYFVSNVQEIQLANYRERYGEVYLKRRMDPLAMRGEKIFIQSCLSCHDSEPGINKARQWVGKHPTVNGSPKLDSREQRAIQSYLEHFKAEKSPATAARWP